MGSVKQDVTNHGFDSVGGGEYGVTVNRAVVFRCYEIPGLDTFEVSVGEGVIAANWHALPDELTGYQAAAVSAMLLDAAEAWKP